MSALQLWLQNHNRRLTQDAIDEALMEYITHVEQQRDQLLAALEAIIELHDSARRGSDVAATIANARAAIAAVKGGAA